VDRGKYEVDVRLNFPRNGILGASDVRSARWRVLVGVISGLDCDEIYHGLISNLGYRESEIRTNEVPQLCI